MTIFIASEFTSSRILPSIRALGRSRNGRLGSFIVPGLVVLLSSPSFATDYEIQPEKSRVRFEIGHSDYAKPVRGRFGNLSGEIGYDANTPNATTAEVVIDASSVDTDNGYRDEHLRTSFFEADRFPDIHFRLGRMLPTEGQVEGELTMRGVSQTVVLTISNLREIEDPTGMRIFRAHATTRLNRRDFGVEEDADRAQGLGKIMAHIQEGLDEFIDDEVVVRLSIVAHEMANDGRYEPLALLD